MTYPGSDRTAPPPGADVAAMMTQPPSSGIAVPGEAQPVPRSTDPGLATSESAIVHGVDVDAVAAAVRACPGVSDLSAGRLGEVASYLPGRRVPGIVIDTDSVTVQVRSRWAVPAADLLAQIIAALAVLRRGRPLRVVVAELDDPPDEPALPAAPAPPAAAGPYPLNPTNVSI